LLTTAESEVFRYANPSFTRLTRHTQTELGIC